MQTDKTTKRAQQVLKQAKITEEQTMGVTDIFEVRRRSGKKFGNEESTTFDGVEMFTKQRKPPTPEKISAILAKGSLRDRFENLSKITSIEKMLMYQKYYQMCVMFKEVDEMLLFIKSKQCPSFLTNIQDMLFEARRVKLTQGFIQQILTIFPEAYQLSWKINEKLVRIDKTDLHFKLEISSNADIDGRVKLFKEKLFDYIHANGEYIPETAIPQSQKAMQMDQEKLKIIKQIEATPLRTEFRTNASNKPTYSSLSQSLIEKIRAKKKNQEAVEEIKQELPIKHYIQMASMLHTYYSTRNVSNMFVTNVIKYALKSLKSIIADEKQLQGYLDKLCEVCPLWIKYVDNEQGKILRMDRNIDMPSINYQKKIVKQNPITELNQFLLQIRDAFNTHDLEQVDQIINRDRKLVLHEIQEQSNRPPKSSKQPTHQDIAPMLSGISSLLELNLQEAHNLQELLKPEIQDINKDHLIMDDKQLEQTYSNIILNLKAINKQQNDRFLTKIQELNDKITDLQSQLEQKFRDERHLVNLINSTTCLQKVMYKENIDDEYFESGVIYIQDNIILIAQDYYADYQIYFKVQDISNIQYLEMNTFEITYKDQLLVIQLDSQEEFNKMDLLLWLHARIRSLDHKLIFQNHLFESPFINETIIDFQRVREDVKLLVKAQEIEKAKAIISSDILHQSLIQLQSPVKDQKMELDLAILLLKQGYEFIKYSSNQRNPNIRVVYLTQDERYLKWKERSQPFDKNLKDRAIALGSIKEIKPTGEGQGFDKFAKKRNQNEDLGITIYGSRKLELDATSMDEKKSFLDCIYIALQNHKMINTS